jgi:hypothetical protein
MDFWSARGETEKIWISLFTPQIGETSYEILPKAARSQIVGELLELRERYPKLSMTKGMIEGLLTPPSNPRDCVFAKSTRCITADLRTRVAPCQFGGNPDCSQCGCVASTGFNSIARAKLPGGIRVSSIYNVSFRLGNVVAAIRGENAS